MTMNFASLWKNVDFSTVVRFLLGRAFKGVDSFAMANHKPANETQTRFGSCPKMWRGGRVVKSIRL
jgi:hypothetical protein